MSTLGMRLVGVAAIAILGASGVAMAQCGNGFIDGDEECDDGGTCIGGSNAGTHCTAESDCIGNGVCVGGMNDRTACTSNAACPGGACLHCVPQGGDGCAANCTLEHAVPFDLVPGFLNGNSLVDGTSGLEIYGEILAIPLPLELPLELQRHPRLRVGRDRGDEIVPVVVRASDAVVQAINVGLACVCVRTVAAKTCGGTVLLADGSTPSPNCTFDDAACARELPCTFVYGEGNVAAGALQCGSLALDGVNITVTQHGSGSEGSMPPLITRSGRGEIGSAIVSMTTAIGTVVGTCYGTDPIYGPDGQFCTPDDPQSARGMPNTSLFVTGTATAELINANGDSGVTLGPFSVTGKPFDCNAVRQGDASPGSALVSALTSLGMPTVGDIVETAQLFAAVPLTPTPTATPYPTYTPSKTCVGDCNGDAQVTIDDLLTMVDIALSSGNCSVCVPCHSSQCTVPTNGVTCPVSVVEIITGLNNAMNGCHFD